MRAQCPSAEVTALPAPALEFWAAVFGVDCSGVEVCDLCGKLTCPGCGPMTACQKCLGHGIDHYSDPERVRTARQQALERARERRRGPLPGVSGLQGGLGAFRGRKARKIENGEPLRGTGVPEEMP